MITLKIVLLTVLTIIGIIVATIIFLSLVIFTLYLIDSLINWYYERDYKIKNKQYGLHRTNRFHKNR